jgi:hypothetical protein
MQSIFQQVLQVDSLWSFLSSGGTYKSYKRTGFEGFLISHPLTAEGIRSVRVFSTSGSMSSKNRAPFKAIQAISSGIRLADYPN